MYANFIVFFSNVPCLKDDILPGGWILLSFAVLHTNAQGRKPPCSSASPGFLTAPAGRGERTRVFQAPHNPGASSPREPRAAGGGQGRAGTAPRASARVSLHLHAPPRQRTSPSSRSPPCPQQKFGLNHRSYDAEHTSVLLTALRFLKSLQIHDVCLNFRALDIRARLCEVWGRRGAEVKRQSEKIILLKQNWSVVFKPFQKNIGYFSLSHIVMRNCRCPAETLLIALGHCLLHHNPFFLSRCGKGASVILSLLSP